MHQLRLPPAAHILHTCTLGEVQGVEHVGEGLGDAWESLGVCSRVAAGQYRRDCQYPAMQSAVSLPITLR
jgi:hypothetical protein